MQVLKTILNYEGTLYLERVNGLKNTINSEGTEKWDKGKKDSSTQIEGGEREEKDSKFQNTFWCVEWTMWVLYL